MDATLQAVLPARRSWPLLDSLAARAWEHQALADSLPHALMARAGADATRLVLARWPHARRIWVACGPGNNGGDGLVLARHLHAAGREVLLTRCRRGGEAPTDAAWAEQQALAAGLRIQAEPPNGPVDLAVDALLGLGQRRAPEGELADTVLALLRCGAPVLALDLPTGLGADNGQPLGESLVRADVTLSLLSLKPGLFTGTGRDVAGEVWHSSLGRPEPAHADLWLLGAADAQPKPGARPHASHKGRFGDLWVLGGATGMTGAATLAASAALAAGAGRVYLATLGEAGDDPLRPALMRRPPDALLQREVLSRVTVVAGCGGGEAIADRLLPVIEHAAQLVLDADALNAIAAQPSLQPLLRARRGKGLATVLTPHPLEAARLLGVGLAEVQADRLGAVRRLSEQLGCVTVLKGSGSLITAPGQPVWLNPTGNARLSTAGTGDVLAGWLGGTWSGESAAHPADERAMSAAKQSVWRHGMAAELGGTASSGPRVLTADLLVAAMAAQG